jgi:2-polyprenyl-3-methyl-5-hydroxy-6-metoxy-1,4-benzoquinol methylase
MLQEAGFAYRSLDVLQNEQGTVDYLGAIDGILPDGCLGAAPFEFVLLTEVLEHVAGWEQAFDNIAALLSPTGSVLLSCPHVYVPHEEPFDFWRPTTHAIEHFASRHGLRVRHLERAGTPADVLGTILEDTQCYPATKHFSARVVAWVARGMRSMLLRGLHSARCRAKVEFRGGTYLSCLAVLGKAGEASLGAP